MLHKLTYKSFALVFTMLHQIYRRWSILLADQIELEATSKSLVLNIFFHIELVNGRHNINQD